MYNGSMQCITMYEPQKEPKKIFWPKAYSVTGPKKICENTGVVLTCERLMPVTVCRISSGAVQTA